MQHQALQQGNSPMQGYYCFVRVHWTKRYEHWMGVGVGVGDNAAARSHDDGCCSGPGRRALASIRAGKIAGLVPLITAHHASFELERWRSPGTEKKHRVITRTRCPSVISLP